MDPTSQELAAAIAAEAAGELADALQRIKHCLGQLTDEQVWWRPTESQNSIGNLVLHLSGNVRQWIVSGIGGVPNERDRPGEFSERGPIPRQELIGRLEAAVREAQAALVATTAGELLRTRRIQGFEVTGLAAIFHSVPHFRGHTQEIIHITRALLGEAYVFAWQPTTPEEGAPA